MKKFLIIVLCLVLVVVTIFIGGKIISAIKDSYYSNKLIEAIRKEDQLAIVQILKERPSCVNAPFSCFPLGLYTLITEHRMEYPIMEACASGNVEIITTLIEAGADVNCNNGLTPLSVTFSTKPDGWYSISQILIENGASLDYTTEYSGKVSSVLQDIVQTRYSNPLLGYEAESEEEVINAFNYALENCDHSKINWMRVLQHSVSNDRIEIVKLLLDQKYCDVNDMSAGKTALMFASRDSKLEMVQLLLDYGADKSIKTSDGKTAYDYAVNRGRMELAEILKP